MALSDNTEIEAWQRRNNAALGMAGHAPPIAAPAMPSFGPLTAPASLGAPGAPPLPPGALALERPPSPDPFTESQLANAERAERKPATPAARAGAPAPMPAGGPMVTTRMGGTTVEQPLPPSGEVSQRSSSGSKSTSRVEETKKEKELVEQQAALDQRAEEQKIEEGNALVKRAEIDKQNADLAAASVAEQNRITQEQIAEKQKLYEAAKAKETEAELAQRQEMKAQPSRRFADRSTSDKITGGIALLLGFFGGGSDGSNVGADAILAAHAKDVQAWQQRLENHATLLKNSRANTADVQAKLQETIQIAGIREIAALEETVAQAEAKLKAIGVDEASIQGNAGIVKLKQAILDKRLAREEGLRATVESQSAWNNTRTTGGAGSAGQRTASIEALEAEQDAQATERFATLVDKNPKAYDDVQKAMNEAARVANAEKIKLFGIGGAVTAGKGWGMIANDVQARLKGNPAALEIFSALSPVVTAKAREADPQGAINQDATDTAMERLGLRSRAGAAVAAEARAMAKKKREKVALLTRGQGVPGAAPPAAPQAPANDIVMVRDKRTGQQIRARRHPDGRLEALE